MLLMLALVARGFMLALLASYRQRCCLLQSVHQAGAAETGAGGCKKPSMPLRQRYCGLPAFVSGGLSGMVQRAHAVMQSLSIKH